MSFGFKYLYSRSLISNQHQLSLHLLRFAMIALLVAMATANAVGFACSCTEEIVPAKAPADIDLKRGIEFSHTPEYEQEFAAATHDAQSYCEKFKCEHPGERNVCVVSDIDETLLDNREFLAAPTFTWNNFDAWAAEGRQPALKDTANFLGWARARGFAVFLVTGRPERDRVGTIESLVRDGIAYDGIYFRPNGQKGPTELYKASKRKEIEEAGFKIVENIGDQFSDLAGGYSLDCEKLPNRMYFIP